MRHFLALFVMVTLMLALVVACGSGNDKATTGDPSSTTTAGTNAATTTPGSASPSLSTADDLPAGKPVYIALGDSLSAGVGASNSAATAFVPLVRDGLGGDVTLLNLGHSGDDSKEITQHGYVDQAVSIIKQRNGDGDPNNNVVLVTLEIGGNDLLDIYFRLVVPGTCPNLEEGLKKPVCVDAVRGALDGYGPNLRGILDKLKQADPNLRVVLLTLYNPFSGRPNTSFEPIGELALEGTPGTPFPEGMNDIIRAEGQAAGATLVDIYPLFAGKAGEYIYFDLIHPNDKGYRVMADAVLGAVRG